MPKKYLQNFIDKLKEHPKLQMARPLISAIDTFLSEPLFRTKSAPHVRDSVDLKRWMFIVVAALLPTVLAAIWNNGVQEFVYSSGNFYLMEEYLQASNSFKGYLDFVVNSGYFYSIITKGLANFLPVLLISYLVGGFWEGIFAFLRKEEISEGFLVSGLLYPLVLPPSLPLWMVALGVSLGIIIGKEIFGGTGMNILNPALTCRCFLYFGYPAYMTGEIWAGKNSYLISQSVQKMNAEAARLGADGISQDSFMGIFNVPENIKKIHVDAIASWKYNLSIETSSLIDKYYQKWTSLVQMPMEKLSNISLQTFQDFLTTSADQGGLGLSPENFSLAEKFVQIKYGLGLFNDMNLFWGNKLGSFGEISIFACLIGALILIVTKVGSWRTMLGVTLGIIFSAFILKYGLKLFTTENGAWLQAQFDFPIYKHFLIGSAAFGLVYMATDPVSSPSMRGMHWVYGFLIGFLIIVIRTANPAYPEGVMLAILFANVFAPLFDYYSVRYYRRHRK